LKSIIFNMILIK